MSEDVIKEVEAVHITIWIAGDVADAKATCRRFCMSGLCVTVEPTDYIYTDGQESGVRIGLLNYPRFPTTAAALWETAESLAGLLRRELCQHSVLISDGKRAKWMSNHPRGA